MAIYGGFAKIYDHAMRHTPYVKWADFIEDTWKRNRTKPKLVLDIACGTGNMTGILASRGYEMIGLDASAEMLSEARAKNPSIFYTMQDMREFELYGTVDATVSVYDGINYILEEDELSQVFRLVLNYLNPGCLFVFDMKTEHLFKTMGTGSYSDSSSDYAYIWNNNYNPANKLNTYQLDYFAPREDGLYERGGELHRQRAYEPKKVASLLTKAGFEYIGVYGDGNLKPPTAESRRVFHTARKKA